MLGIRHWIDWLNILLMLLSAVAAFFLPFELFLFAYAVLGPLHYLTEISWLQQRNFFAQGRWDFIALLVLGVALFVASFMPGVLNLKPNSAMYVGAGITYLAFMLALSMVLFKTPFAKLLFGLGATIMLFGFATQRVYLLFFAVFLPTLVHVYVFTAAFILYGALKSKSSPGILSFFVLLGCGAGLLFWHPESSYLVSEKARLLYAQFKDLNQIILQLLGLPGTDLYSSPWALAIMRFIAFAYTYHYLNWFAKTSIIKWHLISVPRMIGITAGWLVSVGLYAWDYRVGFVALYTLSFLHVYLEFPLNHATFMGIGRELKKRWSPPVEAPEIKTTGPRAKVTA